MDVLIKFNHGLGDCIQFTSVLKHLRKHKPDWNITLQVSDKGKCSIYTGMTNVTAVLESDILGTAFDEIFDIHWWEADSVESDVVPATKVEQCLRRVFKIEPEVALSTYECASACIEEVESYLTEIAGQPHISRQYQKAWKVVVVHYEGNTGPSSKNMTHEVAKKLCQSVIDRGYVPLILDWDNRSPLPDNISIFCPGRDHALWKGLQTGHAATLQTLIERCSLFIGVDSGPHKIAMTTSTPKIIFWNNFSPIHYCCFSSTAIHIIPIYYRTSIRGDKILGEILLDKYKLRIYNQNRENELIDTLMDEILKITTKPENISYCLYKRIGYDERCLEFLPNGLIGAGSAGREKKWRREGDKIIVSGNESDTFIVTQKEFYWEGAWLVCEKMPIRLLFDGMYEKDGFSWCVDAKVKECDVGLTSHEEWLLEHIQVPENGLFVDVGAFVGTHAIKIAKLRKCKCMALEPSPAFDLLCKNIKLNKVDLQVIPVNMGVSDIKERVALSAEGMSSKVERFGSNYANLDRLDNILEKCERVDFIKIDVEGMEIQALNGLGKVLQKKPFILVEVHTRLNPLLEEWVSKWAGANTYEIKTLKKNLLGLHVLLTPKV